MELPSLEVVAAFWAAGQRIALVANWGFSVVVRISQLKFNWRVFSVGEKRIRVVHGRHSKLAHPNHLGERNIWLFFRRNTYPKYCH